jgi:hypothetical protein
MGTQMGVTGRIGNVVHYKMGDKFYTRSLPRKYKQTKGTKAKSSEFGMASTIGMLIRQNLDTVIFEPSDCKMQTRLVGEIYTWLQNARHEPASNDNQPKLDHFFFSSDSPGMSSRWKVNYEVSKPATGQIQIAIPSFIPKSAFRTPAGASAVICKIASVVIDIENKEELGSDKNEISYELDQNRVPAQKIIQELPMPAGSLLITGMCLEYIVNRQQRTVPTNDKLFKPSQIIYAVYN